MRKYDQPGGLPNFRTGLNVFSKSAERIRTLESINHCCAPCQNERAEQKRPECMEDGAVNTTKLPHCAVTVRNGSSAAFVSFSASTFSLVSTKPLPFHTQWLPDQRIDTLSTRIEAKFQLLKRPPKTSLFIPPDSCRAHLTTTGTLSAAA